MKCISIREPWATLIMRRLKDVEIRYWKYVPKFAKQLPVPILIHASSIEMSAVEYFNKTGMFNKMDPGSFRKSVILGAAWLIKIHDYANELDFYNDYRLHLNNEYLLPEKPGFKCIGLEFGGRIPFPDPIPLKGQLGFFNVELSAATRLTTETQENAEGK